MFSNKLPEPKQKLIITDEKLKFFYNNQLNELLKYKHFELTKQQEILFDRKDKLDKYVENTLMAFNPLCQIKKELYLINNGRFNIGIITNAWLKCYEILYEFNLISASRYFTFFDNGALPGSFIFSTIYFANKFRRNTQINWFGNSLICDNKDHIDDIYGLVKCYPNNWIMDNNCNGDILDVKNIKYITEKVIKKNNGYHIDLYMSDIGISFNNFENEEYEFYFLNLAQILCGLITLKPGKHMFFKQFTLYEHNSIALISLLTSLFRHVHVVKPLSSKRYNSEMYIVCKFYNKIIFTDQIKNLLLDKLHYEDRSPIYSNQFNFDFMLTINQINYQLLSKQKIWLNARFKLYYMLKNQYLQGKKDTSFKQFIITYFQEKKYYKVYNKYWIQTYFKKYY